MTSHNHFRKPDQSPVTFPTNIIAQGALPQATPKGLQMGERSTHLKGEFYGSKLEGLRHATIDKLTDDPLLEIFDFYLNEDEDEDEDEDVDKWYTLVHVCQRWRNIVFASPRRLDLRLLCTENRPVRATLDIWPMLPLVIEYHRVDTWEVQGNINAALEHHGRVRQITLGVASNPVWGMLAAAMQVPFPDLTRLCLWSKSEEDRSAPVLPDSFLGGSAPHLELLALEGIPFPAVRNLLLSASDLVYLELWRLPHSGYISPEAMVACLSSLNRLETLYLGFKSHLSRPDQPSPPPQTRVVLPALSYLAFEGMSHYSEDFFARIETPVLNQLCIIFFMDFVFDVPHFSQFVGRARGLKPSKAARLLFGKQYIRLELDHSTGLSLAVWCERIDWQLDSMALICWPLSSFFSSIERFDLIWNVSSIELEGKDDMESTQFLDIFQPFTTIRSLYVTKIFLPFISLALKELIGKSTRVLPNLRDLSLEGSAISGSIQEDIQPFIEARRLSGRPVAVHHWQRGGN